MRTDYIGAVHEHSENMVAVLRAAISIKYDEIRALEAAIRALEYVGTDNQPHVAAVNEALTQGPTEEDRDEPIA